MKKHLLIPFLFLLILSSCTDDDDTITTPINPNTVTVTVDGEEITFANLTISKQDYENPETGYQWTDIRVLGYNTEDALSIIEFIAEEGIIGSDAIWRFTITLNGLTYSQDNSAFTTLVTESTDNTLKGTFSGTLTEPNNTTITVSNGIFDVEH